MDTLRSQSEPLRADKLEAEGLTDENRDLPRLRAAAVALADKTDHTELLRLRNEVRQLRRRQREAEKLRAASQRVADELKAAKFTPRRLADMEGFIARENWTHAGFATPEAAVQNYFTAIHRGFPCGVSGTNGSWTSEEPRLDVPTT